MHPNPKKILPVVLIVALGALAWWYISSARAKSVNGALSASGTIEATKVEIAAEVGGEVSQVLAREGDSLQAGQLLVQFDDALLNSQRAQAQAALELAQAQYDLVAVGPTQEERQVAIASAEMELIAAQQALDALYDNADLVAARTQQEIALAQDAVDRATDRQTNLIVGAEQTDIDAARATVVLVKDRVDEAREGFEPYANKPEDNLVRAALLSKLAAIEDSYDAAVARLNNLLASANEIDLDMAESDLAVAQAQLADAQRRYELVKDGPDPQAVALAEARVKSAEAHLAAAKAETSAEQLAIAQAQVDAAQAALGVIQAQLDKLELKAPMDGIVLTRSVEPGEVTAAGASLLTLASLDDLTITVFVPEDRYGAIRLGQPALVSVDSFPGETFSATVVEIAGEAEYTPRNVQTAEGRRSTVFAVKLAVENLEGKLKPGMPADVTFEE